MPDRPLIMFPQPEEAARTTRKRQIPKPVYPSVNKQYERLKPYFDDLRRAFQQKTVLVQNSPMGLNPEMALVFEIVDSVENFYNAVKKVDGFEWMFETSIDEIEPDDDFFYEGKKDKLSGRVYCIMSNQKAMDQLISLWERYAKGETNIFERGFAGLRDVFVHIKKIRRWGPEDRIYETNVMEYWNECLEIQDNQNIPFEIELFYRNNPEKRGIAYETVKNAIIELGGVIRKECIIDQIQYHALLAELPRQKIKLLVENYKQIKLVNIDDIMFFRPIPQTAIKAYEDNTIKYIESNNIEFQSDAEPIIGIFDGMPIQNHKLLAGRLKIDDPDGYEDGYLEKYRFHGTSMASLVIYGDLNRNDKVHNRKVYFRPVLKPEIDFNGEIFERIPKDELFVDVIHRAVRRIFEGDGVTPAVAPSIRVINISIGDPARQFTSMISPLARLLDWLSFKYKILFIVSAGNHEELRLGITFDEFKGMSLYQRNEVVFSYLRNEIRNHRILSPSESINSLTIGALYTDACHVEENKFQAMAVSNGLPSPISSFGLGYNRSIKPDLYYYGGRKFLVYSFKEEIKWSGSSREPGCKVAAPYGDGTESGIAYSFGTSDAAAQITHEAGKCYDVLNEIFLNDRGHSIPDDFAAVLIKGMLVHGASWDIYSDELSMLTKYSAKRLFHWLGNGVPDISRVMECTDKRITLIGFGKLEQDAAHVYYLPLPFDLTTKLVKRRLIVTLAYLSPIAPSKKKYRKAQLWFEVEPQEVFAERQNTDYNIVRRGTIQHEIFSGDNAVIWDPDDKIKIKVNCKKDAEDFKEKIAYGLFVTFEAAEGLDVDVYTAIVNKIRQVVPITTI